MLERILIVGLGSIGTRHARLAREVVPDVRIAAWRHGEPSRVPPEGIECIVANLDEALEFRPQLAVIASPATKHMEVAVPLAEAGVHLFVEKPIANSSRGVVELIETCRARGVVLMTGYNLRFLPSLRRFRELLSQRRVGRVLSVRVEVGQYLPTWRPEADYRDTVSAQEKLGGGVLLELSHEIDYLQWLFGEVEWVNATVLRVSDLAIDVEDTAHLVLGFVAAEGKVPVVASVDMDFLRHDATRSCTVIGTRGTLRWNALEGIVSVYEPAGVAWEILCALPVSRDESYLGQWRQLLSCLESGESPSVTGEEGLATLRVIEAVRRSSRTGARVSLGEESHVSVAERRQG
ncbi:MAG: Gfo/Idh/MocA family protein [Longimicrobiales bacterium]